MYCPFCGDVMKSEKLPPTGTSVDFTIETCPTCNREYEVGIELQDGSLDFMGEVTPFDTGGDEWEDA